MDQSKAVGCCGVHSVQALLSAKPEVVTQLFIQSTKLDQSQSRLLEVYGLAQQHKIPCQLVDEVMLTRLSGGQPHQGVFANYHPVSYAFDDLLNQLSDSTCVLVLDGVQDPHNLGACLRTAWAAGVQAVVVPKDRSVGLTATVHKVASGAAACVPLIQVTNLAGAMAALKKKGVWCYGATESGQQSLYGMDFKGPVAMVLGAEGRGLRSLTERHCDAMFHIPTAADFSTLNVSVATGVCLFEVLRQRTHQS